MKDVTLRSHVFCAVPTGHDGILNSVDTESAAKCCLAKYFPTHVHVYWWGSKRSHL